MPYIILSSNLANMFITQMSDFYRFLFFNFLLINLISIFIIFNKFTFKIQISLEKVNILLETKTNNIKNIKNKYVKFSQKILRENNSVVKGLS